MDKLKGFVDSHQADFKECRLPEGHRERFERKLAVFRGEHPEADGSGREAQGGDSETKVIGLETTGVALEGKEADPERLKSRAADKQKEEDSPSDILFRLQETDASPLYRQDRQHKARIYSLWASFAAAAAIALFFLLRIPGGTTFPVSPVPSSATVQTCKAQQEIEELRIYYTMQINEMMVRIETLYKQDKTPGSAELLGATKKILTDNYMFEETVLPTLPCSNEALFAMTQHYTNSLESLSIMLKQMERVTHDDR